MLGANERRLRRMEQYAARRSDRRQRRRWCLDGWSGTISLTPSPCLIGI